MSDRRSGLRTPAVKRSACTSSWTARLAYALAFAGVVATATACGSSTSPPQRPSEATVRLTGETTVPLRLIVSTDFFETLDPLEGTRDQVFVTADTLTIETLPYNETFVLGALSSIVVDVSNPDETPATVRLEVELNGGQQPFEQEGVMSQGGSIRYVYNWISPQL